MLPGHVVVHSHDGALEYRPHALDRVGVHVAPDVFLRAVIDALVLVEDSLDP